MDQPCFNSLIPIVVAVGKYNRASGIARFFPHACTMQPWPSQVIYIEQNNKLQICLKGFTTAPILRPSLYYLEFARCHAVAHSKIGHRVRESRQ